jgi:hypothetical protein
MKKAFLFFPILFFVSVSRAQLGLGLGIKAGANFANVSNASSINNSNASGFLFGAWLGGRKKLLRYRMELIFSRQGYDYKTSTNNGTVNLDYLLVPQLLTLNFGKFSIHGGGQVAFLLNAHVDSASGDNNPYGDFIDFLNRFDYGIAVGAEVFPYRSLILGVRYNRSLNDLYKSVTYSGGQINFAAPDLKNNVVQLYAGLRFGK